MKGFLGDYVIALLRDYGVKGVTVVKVLVTAVLVAWYVWMPEIGFSPVGQSDGHSSGTISEHLLWPLSHANVWHLAGNLWVLWWLKGRLYMTAAYVIAVVCSFLPVLPGVWEMVSAAEPLSTVGFSGVLCVIIGVRWGQWIRIQRTIAACWTFAKRVLPFVMAGMFIPHVNWSIHLYCLLAGLVYGVVGRMGAMGVDGDA